MPGVTAGLVLIDEEPATTVLDPGTTQGLAALGLLDHWMVGRLFSGATSLSDLLIRGGFPLLDLGLPGSRDDLEELLYRSESFYEREFFERERVRSLSRLAGPLAGAAREIPMPIAVARQPELERTHSPGAGVSAGNGQFTLGAVVSDAASNQLGYLTCAHGMPPLEAGDQIPCECLIERLSDPWDAAFLLPGCAPGAVAAQTGLLAHRAPAKGEWGHFVGAISGREVAEVDSSDPILPHYETGRFGQVGRFYTNRATVPGDSGALLVLNDAAHGLAAGLAVARTEDGERIDYSVWMWLAGVLEELEVDLVGWAP